MDRPWACSFEALQAVSAASSYPSVVEPFLADSALNVVGVVSVVASSSDYLPYLHYIHHILEPVSFPSVSSAAFEAASAQVSAVAAMQNYATTKETRLPLAFVSSAVAAVLGTVVLPVVVSLDCSYVEEVLAADHEDFVDISQPLLLAFFYSQPEIQTRQSSESTRSPLRLSLQVPALLWV